MSFLSPFFLYGLLAVAVPILIHLINKRRHRTVKWGAMQFLLRATRESRGKKKLKHLLILVARALAVAALVFALARPLLGGFLGWGGGSIDLVVLVLDRSASLEQRASEDSASARELLLKKAQQALLEANVSRVVLIDSASGEAQEVPDPRSLAKLRSTKATQTRADIPSLVLSAFELIKNTDAGNAEIWVASDLSFPDWNPKSQSWELVQATASVMEVTPSVRILVGDTSQATNQALLLNSARRLGDELSLDLTILRQGAEGSEEVPLTFNVNNAKFTEVVTVRGQEYRFQKQFAIPEGQDQGYGSVSLAGDLNSQDNDVFFTYREPRETLSYLVVDDTGFSSEVLSRAAAPSGYQNQRSISISSAQFGATSFDEASLVILLTDFPTGEAGENLRSFLDEGGVVVSFPTGAKSATPFAGVQWGEVQEAPQDQFFVTGQVRRQDGPWRDGLDGVPLPTQRLRAIKRQAVESAATPLAFWDDGEPILLRQPVGSGTLYVVTTLPDYLWSNLEETALHLVLLQRLIAEGAQRLDGSNQRTVGQETPLDQVAGQVLLASQGSSPAQSQFQAGVFQVGEDTFALNRPVSESDPERVPSDLLAELLPGINLSLFEDQLGDDVIVKEVWRAFLFGMLVFLLLEAALCLQKKRGEKRSSIVQASPVPSS